MTEYLPPLSDACTEPDCGQMHTCRIFVNHEGVDPNNVDMDHRDGEIMLHLGAHVNQSHNQCASLVLTPQDAVTLGYALIGKATLALASLCDGPAALQALANSMLREAHSTVQEVMRGRG